MIRSMETTETQLIELIETLVDASTKLTHARSLLDTARHAVVARKLRTARSAVDTAILYLRAEKNAKKVFRIVDCEHKDVFDPIEAESEEEALRLHAVSQDFDDYDHACDLGAGRNWLAVEV